MARSELESLNQVRREMAAESLQLDQHVVHQAGESTVLEVVDAQNTLTLTRNAFNDGQVRFRVSSMANLQTLTGNLMRNGEYGGVAEGGIELQGEFGAGIGAWGRVPLPARPGEVRQSLRPLPGRGRPGLRGR